MRLISCYIEKYGKLQGKTYDFAEGITSFYQENGEGKTTLASFLKAMFYGLDTYGKNATKTFCDRAHFYPFDGGLFGGNLTFEKEGKRYKIERFFGETSKTADSVKLYENDVELDIPEGDIGKWAFGVDRESFERTTFLESGDIELKATASIHAQLNRFLEGNEEDIDADGAKKALKKAAKEYKKSRAAGSMDKVTEATRQIEALKAEIANATRIQEALQGKYARFAELEGEIARLNGEISRAQEQNEKRSQAEHYESLCEGAQGKENTLRAIEEKYPNGLPTLAQTNELNAYLARSKELEASVNGLQFSQKDGERLATLEEIFTRGVPTEETLLSVENTIRAHAELETEARLAEKTELRENDRRVAQIFAYGAPEEGTIASAEEKVEVYKQRQRAYADMPDTVQAPPEEKPKGKGYLLVTLLSLLVCVGGVAGMFYDTFIGLAIVLIGVSLMAGSGFNYLSKKSAPAQNTTAENPEKRKLEYAIRELEDEIKAVLMPYGYYSGNGLAYDFSMLKKDAEEYRRLQADEVLRAEKLERLRGEITRAEEELTAFFRGYGLAGDTYVKGLSDLRVKIGEYADLSARKKSSEQGLAVKVAELTEVQAFIEGYRSCYATVEKNLAQIAEDVRTAERLRKEIEKTRSEAAAYKAEKGLEEWLGVEKIELAPLQTSLSRLQEEKSRLDREIAADEMQAERLDGYEAEKREVEARKKGYEQKYKLFTAAGALLTQAEGRLRDKYVRPFKEEFLYYAGVLESALGERVTITKDFELRFEKNGAERSEKYLSAGQRSVCALCFRLALIKNMYQGGLPFLILDDPFTSLDEGHIERVKEVLRALSKDMQMIYFTCHESRKL